MLKGEVSIQYSIGKVAEETGLSIHTLRYYEKEGILPPIKRNDLGMRVFDKDDMEWLEFTCCLRNTGMTIEEMKTFSHLTLQGDETVPQRIALLNQQQERVMSQVSQLNTYLSMIKYKIEKYSPE
ncbi:MerR family transcriptional regulator [Saccharibacillus kuerlensis]|uniref:MerR family transcriptional regulator n=1 Tax=Saccharibacillus kuerlensis TaxID=459527 RepID=A0ABQ2L5I4_9BACL|nr:MerR family transcriptional regulator [Saccharibacillus kuerlensis]